MASLSEENNNPEEYLLDTLNNLDIGFVKISNDGFILNHNLTFNKIFGYDPEESLIGTKILDYWLNSEERNKFREILFKKGIVKKYIAPAKKLNGEKILIQLSIKLNKDSNGEIISSEGFFIDITESLEAEQKLKESEDKLRKLNIELEQRIEERTKELKESEENHRNLFESVDIPFLFLKIANVHTEMYPLFQEFTEGIMKFTNCTAVGIRILDEDGNIPYEAFKGFSKEFYESESPLSIKSDKCMCINVIKGGTDSKLPFYTANGSFYMNGTTRFLATVSEEDKGQTRNMCNVVGYESVALIPIPLKDNTLGLIYVADPQENMVPLQNVEILEKIAAQLGTAIQRVWIQQKLKESEEMYRLIAENANDLIAILNDKFEYEYINEQVHKKEMGYSRDELIGKTAKEFIHPEDVMKAIKLLRKGFKIGEGEGEIRIKKKNGDYSYMEIRGRTFIDRDKKTMGLVISRDITEKKKHEIQIEEQNKKLNELNKLKTELMRRTSHELKTPLIAIQGFADLLLAVHYDKLDEEIISIVKEIKQGCKRLKYLIDDILEASQLESEKVELNPSLENLSFLIKFCAKELKMLLKRRNQTLILNIHDKLKTMFEKERIYDVLTNLLSNAMKYSPQKSEIVVESEIKDEFIIISIKDEGIGFTEEEKERIFTQFGKIEHYGQGLDIETEGTGLGLYITKRIVELHGGKVWLESEGKDKGSTFYFSLPVVKKKHDKNTKE